MGAPPIYGLFAASLAAIVLSSSAIAQQVTASGCPSRDFVQKPDTTFQAVPPLAQRMLEVDTSYTLAITQRHWQRDNFVAGLAVNVAGRGWHACAGASVSATRIEVHLRNVHGRIYHRISLEDFRAQVRRQQRE